MSETKAKAIRPFLNVIGHRGSYYLPATDETIPADMATPSPDERFHHCTYYPMLPMQLDWAGPVFESTAKTRCFFAPMNTM